MTHSVKILCPGRKCGKCRKMINRVEFVAKETNLDINIEIIDNIDELVNYATWLLPTLVINDKIIARGYTPELSIIKNHLSGAL
ncbi:MAG: thioredoxin family protein [bacterium]